MLAPEASHSSSGNARGILMAKKIVCNAGIVVAGAAVIGSNIPANAFHEVPAATDLSYDYSSSYGVRLLPDPPQLPTLHLFFVAEQQTEYVAPAQQIAQAETTSAQAPAPAADKTPAPATNNAPATLSCLQPRLPRVPVTFGGGRLTHKNAPLLPPLHLCSAGHQADSLTPTPCPLSFATANPSLATSCSPTVTTTGIYG